MALRQTLWINGHDSSWGMSQLQTAENLLVVQVLVCFSENIARSLKHSFLARNVIKSEMVKKLGSHKRHAIPVQSADNKVSLR